MTSIPILMLILALPLILTLNPICEDPMIGMLLAIVLLGPLRDPRELRAHRRRTTTLTIILPTTPLMAVLPSEPEPKTAPDHRSLGCFRAISAPWIVIPLLALARELDATCDPASEPIPYSGVIAPSPAQALLEGMPSPVYLRNVELGTSP